MEERDELRVEFSEDELCRIRKVAEQRGQNIEDWAREQLLRILSERDQQA